MMNVEIKLMIPQQAHIRAKIDFKKAFLELQNKENG